MGTFFTLLEWKESFFSFELSIAHGARRWSSRTLSTLPHCVWRWLWLDGKNLISISPSSHKNYYYDESRNLIVVENMSFFLTLLLNSLGFQAIRKISIQALFRDEHCMCADLCLRKREQARMPKWNVHDVKHPNHWARAFASARRCDEWAPKWEWKVNGVRISFFRLRLHCVLLSASGRRN